MYTIEGIIDVAMPGGCKGWKTEAHRNLAVKLCIYNEKVETMDRLKDICQEINKLSEENLQPIEEDLRKKGIIR